MLLRFAYLKLQRPHQSIFTPAAAVTAFVESRSSSILPLGGSGVNAPSTLIVDEKENKFFLTEAFSTVNATITALTSTEQNI